MDTMLYIPQDSQAALGSNLSLGKFPLLVNPPVYKPSHPLRSNDEKVVEGVLGYANYTSIDLFLGRLCSMHAGLQMRPRKGSKI